MMTRVAGPAALSGERCRGERSFAIVQREQQRLTTGGHQLGHERREQSGLSAAMRADDLAQPCVVAQSRDQSLGALSGRKM